MTGRQTLDVPLSEFFRACARDPSRRARILVLYTVFGCVWADPRQRWRNVAYSSQGSWNFNVRQQL